MNHEAPRNDGEIEVEYQSTQWKNTDTDMNNMNELAANYEGHSGAQGWHSPCTLHSGIGCVSIELLFGASTISVDQKGSTNTVYLLTIFSLHFFDP